MKVNDDCRLWYNRIGDFFDVGMGERKEILYGEGLACKVPQSDPTLQCEATGNNCCYS